MLGVLVINSTCKDKRNSGDMILYNYKAYVNYVCIITKLLIEILSTQLRCALADKFLKQVQNSGTNYYCSNILNWTVSDCFASFLNTFTIKF